MPRFIHILIVLSLLSCTNNRQFTNIQTIDLSEDIVIPKTYLIAKCVDHIIVDGKANEACWENAQFSDPFIDIEGVKIPKYETRFKMLWSEKYLYVFAQLEEPHIWGNITQRDAVIFMNNNFEVFLDPSMMAKRYGEIEINALGTVWDLLLEKPYRVGGKPIRTWNLSGLKTAVHIDGTLNDPADVDSFWSVEMAIPLSSLMELRARATTIPKEGDQWRINFSRVEWEHDIVNGIYDRKKEKGKYLPEYNWVWSNQNEIDMHQPEKWGYLQFTHKPTAKNVKFIEDEHLLTRQMAFALFRKVRDGSLGQLWDRQAGYSQEFVVSCDQGLSLHATFYRTHFGYEFKLEDPASNQIFVINEEGVLKSFQ